MHQPITQRHLSWLFEVLVKPFLPSLEGYHRLIVIPDSALHAVPFHALYDGCAYVLDHFEIQYAPSMGILNLCTQIREQKDGAGALSQVLVMGYTNDDQLPHIREEVHAIAAVFPEAKCYVDHDATIQNLYQNQRGVGIMHLATHGAFREDNPLFSSLRFADGYLIAREIYHLRSDTLLVTLSACETGVSQIIGGDLFGMARGWFFAGVPTLMASSWPVHDSSTAILMQHFYERLKQGESAVCALRKAQLKVRDTEATVAGEVVKPYEHPYYWAPFAIIGANTGFS